MIGEYLGYVASNIKGLSFTDLLITQEYFIILMISVLCWWSMYGIIHFFVNIQHKTQKEIYDTKSRIISIVHASLLFLFAVIDILFFQANKCGQQNSRNQNLVLIISAGYFIYDLFNCILLGVSDKEMELHHSFVILGLYMGVAFDNSANEMLRAILVAEVTNPIMHIRMILRNYELKNSFIYLVLEIVYIIIYIIARMVYGTRVVFFTVFCWDNLLLVKVAGSGVWIQSVIFAKRMVRILRHRYKEYRERKKKNVELYWFSNNKKIEEMDYYINSLRKKKEYIP